MPHWPALDRNKTAPPFPLPLGICLGRNTGHTPPDSRMAKQGDSRACQPLVSCATISVESQSPRRIPQMAYIIAEPCIGTKDTACVDACPVDCIHPKKDEDGFGEADQLFI